MREFPEQEKRVETGPIRFGNDWPGYFIRGDDSMGLAMDIQRVEELLKDNPEARLVLMSLSRHRETILKDVIL